MESEAFLDIVDTQTNSSKMSKEYNKVTTCLPSKYVGDVGIQSW